MVVVTALQEEPKNMLEQLKIIPYLIPNQQIFTSFQDSIAWVQINKVGAE